MIEHDSGGGKLRPRGHGLHRETGLIPRRGIVASLDADLAQPVIVTGPDHDIRFGSHRDGGLSCRFDKLDGGRSIGHDLHLVDPRLGVGMTARGEQVDGVGRGVLEQELRHQGLAVVGHLAIDRLTLDHKVAPGDRRRGMNSQLGPRELRRLEIALVLLDGLPRPL